MTFAFFSKFSAAIIIDSFSTQERFAYIYDVGVA